MEYSQRQIQRSAAAFQFGSVPPADVPAPTQELGRPQRLLLACAAAYMVLATVPPPDEPCAFGNQEFRPHEIARAPSEAYWQFGTNPPEDVPETFGFQDQQPRPLPRAATSAYFRLNGVPPPNVSEDTLIETQLALPQRLPYAGRAAYQIYARIPPEDEPAAFGMQDVHPRALPRAGRAAYVIRTTFVEPSLLSASNGWQTDRTPALLRAAQAAYWLEQRPTSTINPDVPMAWGVQDQTPRATPRATPQTYFLEQRPIWLELGEPVGRGFIDTQLRPLPRAGKAAYAFINRAPADQQPVAWGHQTIAAPAAQRASAAAYWVEHVVGIEGPDKPASDGYQANNVRSVPRAGQAAYRLIAPKGLDEPETSTGYIEQRTRTLQRAPTSAYFIEQRSAIYEPDRPVAFGHQTAEINAIRRSPKNTYDILQGVPAIEVPAAGGYQEAASLQARRASARAYGLPQRSQAGEVGIPAASGDISKVARGFSRAAPSAYWQSAALPPADPPTPGSVLLPKRAPTPRRSAADAYFRQTAPPIVESLPPGRGFVQQFARPEPRALAAVYGLQIFRQVDEAALPATGWRPDRATAAPRAAASAYWLPPRAGIEQESRPAAFGWQSERAPAARRAGHDAYRASVSAPAAAEPSVFGFQSRPIPPLRAAGTAYSIVAQFVVAEEPPALGYIEPFARDLQRSAQSAYWLPQCWQTVGLDQPAAWGFQETLRIPLPRAQRWAYQVVALFGTPEIVRTGPVVQVYGSSGELAQVFGSSGGVLQVYGEESGNSGQVRGAT